MKRSMAQAFAAIAGIEYVPPLPTCEAPRVVYGGRGAGAMNCGWPASIDVLSRHTATSELAEGERQEGE